MQFRDRFCFKSQTSLASSLPAYNFFRAELGRATDAETSMQ
jgi:hypothetical protein